MPIDYGVIQNALTIPPSNTCRIEPRGILNEEDIAASISAKNPMLGQQMIVAVLEKLKEEVLVQLAAGNTVKFTNFISFVTTLPGKLALPTDPADVNKLQIVCKVQQNYKEELRQIASLNKTGYPVKGPQIVGTFDTNLDMPNYIETGRPFKIVGANFSFDPNDPEQGVFTTTTAGVTTRQTNYAERMPSSITIIPAANVATDGGKVDVTVEVRARYTTNGQLKTGVFANRVRSLHSGSNVLFGVAGGTNPVGYTVTGLSNGARYTFTAYLRPDNIVEMSVGAFGGAQGTAVAMPLEATEYTISSAEEVPVDFTVEISSMSLLVTNLLTYGRYMQDVSAYAAA